MKEQITTHKAEGLGSARGAAPIESEVRGRMSAVESVPQQLNDEQLVLDTIMQALRGLRSCRLPQVANIAREWERIFNFRIQVTTQERQRRAKARLVRMQVAQVLNAERGVRNGIDTSPGAESKLERRTSSDLRPPSPHSGEGSIPKGIISSPSGVHIRLNVSPGRD